MIQVTDHVKFHNLTTQTVFLQSLPILDYFDVIDSIVAFGDLCGSALVNLIGMDKNNKINCPIETLYGNENIGFIVEDSFDYEVDKRNSIISLSTRRSTLVPHENNPSQEDTLKQSSVFKGCLRYVGIICCLLSSLVFSLATVVVKVIQSYHALNLALYRFSGVLFPSLLILAYHYFYGNRQIFQPLINGTWKTLLKNYFLLFLRGGFAFFAVSCQIYSLQYLDIADSTVIVFSSPVLVGLLAHFFLKEKLGIVPVLVSLLCLVGVVIITRPPFLTGGEYDSDTLIGAGMAFGSTIVSAAVYIVLRQIRDMSTAIVTTSFGLIGALFCIILSLSLGIFQLPQTELDWCFALALGTLTFLGQLFLTLALQYEQAGPISLIRTGDVVFAFIWQYIFLDAHPDIFSFIGAILIIICVIVVAGRKWISTLSEEDPKRKLFRILLL